MNHNLAVPYSDIPSPPQTSSLSFYCPESLDLLFKSSMLSPQQPNINIICQSSYRSVGLKWTLHRNRLDMPFHHGKAEALPANQFLIEIAPDNLPAGFYDLKVTLDTGISHSESKTLTAICTFGWNAEEMAIRETEPADFQDFWASETALLATVPLDFKQESAMESFNREEIGEYNLSQACLPADYDPEGHKFEEVESCKISFAGPDGGRVYAWLAKPKGYGPFPAMLVLPGAGFNARPRPLEHARHGYLAIDIQIHGQDVDLPEYPKLSTVNDDSQLNPVIGHYYRNVHLRIEQAINLLVSRPDVDSKRIVVVGGSQGGRLGVVAAGLDSRVAAVVSCIAHSGNYPHLAWIARMNGLNHPDDNPKEERFKDRLQFDGMDLKEAPPADYSLHSQTLAYYDPMNYAPYIQCPVLMNVGLIDPVSPPVSVFAIFNRLGTKDKTMVSLPGLGHDWSAEFDRRAWQWLDKKLNS
jgi:cephalosporin-C deacetylase